MLLPLVMLVGQVMHAQSASSSLKLGYVEDVAFGCGGSISYNLSDLRKGRFLLITPMDEATYVNLDGRNVKLRLVASSKTNAKEKVGDRSWETYVARNIQVKVEYVVTDVCDPNDESCEVTYYRTKMTVIRGNQRTVVKAIALFGC